MGGALLSESAGQLPAGPVRARVLPCVLVTAVAPRPSPWGVNKAIGREAHTMVSSASGRVSERRSCLCWDLEPPPLGGAPRQPWAEPSGGPGWGEWAERSYRQGPGQAGRSSDPGPGWVPGAQLLTGPTWGLPQCRALLGARAWLDPGRAQPWWFCGPVAGTPCAEGQCRPTRWRGHFRLAPALIRGLQALQNCDGCCWPPGHLGAHASPEGSPVCFLLFASACPCVPPPLGSSCSPMATPQGPFISLMSRGKSQPIQRPSGPCRVPILLVAGRGEGRLAGPDPRLCWQWGLREEWGVMGWAMGPRGGTGRWSLGGSCSSCCGCSCRVGGQCVHLSVHLHANPDVPV